MPSQKDNNDSETPRKGNRKPARSTNPKWLDTTRFFYADSFGFVRNRDLRAAQNDFSDLTEDEQRFAIAHLQYLDLMAQAGTQRLLMQIHDVLEEIADGLAADRDERRDGHVDDDEEDGDDFDDWEGEQEGDDPDSPPVFPHPVAPNDPDAGKEPGELPASIRTNDQGADPEGPR